MRLATWMKAGLLAAAIGAASVGLAQGGPPPGAGPGGGYGPGMMGGQGMMGGYGGGYGPGMMGGYGGGYGPGMMGGYGGGYGPGMMGGRGMMGGGYGPGMMGGYGAGYGAYAGLDLTDEQRQKLAALGEQSRSKAWDAMGRLRAEQYRLREMLRAEPVNAGAVVDQQAKIDELRRQVLKSRVESRNEMAAVLTPEQRKKLREAGPWWYEDGPVE